LRDRVGDQAIAHDRAPAARRAGRVLCHACDRAQKRPCFPVVTRLPDHWSPAPLGAEGATLHAGALAATLQAKWSKRQFERIWRWLSERTRRSCLAQALTDSPFRPAVRYRNLKVVQEQRAGPRPQFLLCRYEGTTTRAWAIIGTGRCMAAQGGECLSTTAPRRSMVVAVSRTRAARRRRWEVST
jgi:hypothetical protein